MAANRIDLSGNDITVDGIRVGASTPGSTGTELTGTEIAYLDSITPGTVAASKALVADASKTVTGLTILDVRGPVGTGATGAGLLKLTTSELTVAVGTADQLGRIDFQAPLEADGTDAILVGASIWAEAGTDFSATVNDTDLVFATAVSEAAAEKMRLTGAGVLEVIGATGYVAASRPVVADATGPVALTANQSGALCVFDKTDGAIFTLPAAVAGLWYDFVVAVASSSNAHRVNCTTGDFLLGSVMLHATDDTGLSSAAAANGTTHLAINLDADAVGRLAGSKFRVTAISGTQWVIEGDLLATGTVATPFETS